jgi:hypothetical protein
LINKYRLAGGLAKYQLSKVSLCIHFKHVVDYNLMGKGDSHKLKSTLKKVRDRCFFIKFFEILRISLEMNSALKVHLDA